MQAHRSTVGVFFSHLHKSSFNQELVMPKNMEIWAAFLTKINCRLTLTLSRPSLPSNYTPATQLWTSHFTFLRSVQMWVVQGWWMCASYNISLFINCIISLIASKMSPPPHNFNQVFKRRLCIFTSCFASFSVAHIQYLH